MVVHIQKELYWSWRTNWTLMWVKLSFLLECLMSLSACLTLLWQFCEQGYNCSYHSILHSLPFIIHTIIYQRVLPHNHHSRCAFHLQGKILPPFSDTFPYACSCFITMASRLSNTQRCRSRGKHKHRRIATCTHIYVPTFLGCDKTISNSIHRNHLHPKLYKIITTAIYVSIYVTKSNRCWPYLPEVVHNQMNMQNICQVSECTV